MNISEAAEKSGLTAVTLRYYERIGLIPPVTRGNGGVRLYKESDLGWIDFIKCMRNAGLSIESLMNTQLCSIREKIPSLPGRKS